MSAMCEFVQLVVQEKSGGRFDGNTPDYRAFLYYRIRENPDVNFELRGYGPTGAAAASDAWGRFFMICEECDD